MKDMKRDIYLSVIIGTLIATVLCQWSQDWTADVFFAETMCFTFLSGLFLIGTNKNAR